MLSRRVTAVTADPQLGKRLSQAAGAAGATLEIVASADELLGDKAPKTDPDLLLYHAPHLPDAKLSELLGRMKPEPPVVVVTSQSNLEQLVELWKDRHVGNVVVGDAETLDVRAVTGVASRLLYGDVFGLERYLSWGVRVYTILIGDYQEKAAAITAAAEFAGAMGVRRKHRETIEQCLDELLMNALYDAPTDATGKQIFADLGTKQRIGMRMEQKAVLQYACDGSRFVVSARDSFGSLKRPTVVRFLDKCLHSDQQIDRKAGGAGLGLYLLASSVSELAFCVYPGVATEVICSFELDAPKTFLRNFSFYEERIPALARNVGKEGSRLVTLRRGSPWWMKAALALSVVGLVAAGGVIAWPRVHRPAHGALVVTTDPPGAEVTVDDRDVGRASDPLRVGGLRAGQRVLVRAHLDGYEDALAAAVPVTAAPGAPVPLRLHPTATVVHVASEPPGAHLYLGASDTGLVTPVDIHDLGPGESRTYRLKLGGYLDEEVPVGAGDEGSRGNVLVRLERHLAPGQGLLSVRSNVPVHVFIDGDDAGPAPVLQAPVPAGPHKLRLVATDGRPLVADVLVSITDGAASERDFTFGTVKADGGVLIAGRGLPPDGVRQVALEAGPHKLTLVSPNGDTEQKDVTVPGDGSVSVAF